MVPLVGNVEVTVEPSGCISRAEPLLSANIGFGCPSDVVPGQPSELVTDCTDEELSDALVKGRKDEGGVEITLNGETEESASVERASCLPVPVVIDSDWYADGDTDVSCGELEISDPAPSLGGEVGTGEVSSEEANGSFGVLKF